MKLEVAEIVLIFVIFAACLFAFSVSRGKKAVRAYIYLVARGEGATEGEANGLALRIDTHRAGQLNLAMAEFVKMCYGGSQLTMISDARIDGFRE